MATIENYLLLKDGFSPVLDKISKSSNVVSNKFEQVSRTSEIMSNSFNNANSSASRLGDVLKGTLGANLIISAAEKAKESIVGLFAMSDKYAMVKARLGLVADSQENASYLNQKIYESAQRARGGYLDMAHAVSQIAMSAKDAFPDPEEAVRFMEGINKLYSIGGTTGENKKFATLQLTQGLASGRLQGDEFRSIAENAPIVENMIAKTMGVARGELKNLASQGLITADVVKRAVLENMDEINAQFAHVPKTWSDSMTIIKNEGINAFSGVFDLLSNLSNSDTMNRLTSSTVKGIDYLAGATFFLANNAIWLAGIIGDILGGAFDFLSEHSWIVYGALVGLSSYLAYVGILYGIHAVQVGVATIAMMGKAVADTVATVATTALALAQGELNVTMLACPVAWIVGAIVALVAVFYLAINAVNYFAGTSISATGIIFGAFSWLFGGIYNFIAVVWNHIAMFANFFANVFKDPVNAVYNFFADLWNGVAELTQHAINSIIDMINKIPGINLGHVGSFTIDRRAINGGEVTVMNKLAYANLGEWAKTGYKTGANVANNISNIFNDPLGNINKILGRKSKYEYKKPTQVTLPMTNAKDPNSQENAKNHAKTAKNTERMARAIEMTDEEIKNLRDSAIRDTIQKWQNQHIEIKVDNTINATSDVDLDGFTSDFAKGLREAITVQGERGFA